MIDYTKAIKALEKERQYLLNRGQYGAEHVLVHHALNVITELPVIWQPEIVRCGECAYFDPNNAEEGDCSGRCRNDDRPCQNQETGMTWFCADGERKE